MHERAQSFEDFVILLLSFRVTKTESKFESNFWNSEQCFQNFQKNGSLSFYCLSSVSLKVAQLLKVYVLISRYASLKQGKRMSH